MKKSTISLLLALFLVAGAAAAKTSTARLGDFVDARGTKMEVDLRTHDKDRYCSLRLYNKGKGLMAARINLDKAQLRKVHSAMKKSWKKLQYKADAKPKVNAYIKKEGKNQVTVGLAQGAVYIRITSYEGTSSIQLKEEAKYQECLDLIYNASRKAK